MAKDKTFIRTIQSYAEFLNAHADLFTYQERRQIRKLFDSYVDKLNPEKEEHKRAIEHNFAITNILLNEISLGKTAIVAFWLQDIIEAEIITVEEVYEKFNVHVGIIVHGLLRVKDLYTKNTSLESENFRKLLLSFAEDIRVILIILAEQLQIMRTLNDYPEEKRIPAARESAFLYAPMAHRMGLYAIKTELEDLSLKYTNREIYSDIAHKLNETKRSREKYIKEFIQPLEEKLQTIGHPFSIKGRTKSIHSIYNKIKKQDKAFEQIYDLFAIRIIYDVPPEIEKAVCWQAYSIVTDMYQPNPKRLRDWLSIPKSNGYESLHTTVIGPRNQWVEVQIRTERMDEVAEKGLAAHWKYKGLKGESEMDEWLKNIRDILENPDLNAVDFMDEFKLNLYDEEVFAFTPNGDLHKFPKGATALDFAFSIHSGLGVKCVGAKVNGKNVPIKYKLQNGDQVEVLTSPTQKPNVSWLKIVTTSKARNKIRQALKEIEYKDAEIGRETLERRFKNWKLDLEEGRISKLAKKKGFKRVSDFYQELASGKLDIFEIRDAYIEIEKKDSHELPSESRSAEGYTKEAHVPDSVTEDVLVIGKDLKNIDFQLAKCCNPIYGDSVFGFVSVSGGIKIHRTDCPNAPEMISRYGYRIIPARWSGKSVGSQYPVNLGIVGHDDMGVVANITSLIASEPSVSLRSISIDSHSGLFEGNLTVMVSDNTSLKAIVKKIKQVKGVKNVLRN